MVIWFHARFETYFTFKWIKGSKLELKREQKWLTNNFETQILYRSWEFFSVNIAWVKSYKIIKLIFVKIWRYNWYFMRSHQVVVFSFNPWRCTHRYNMTWTTIWVAWNSCKCLKLLHAEYRQISVLTPEVANTNFCITIFFLHCFTR